MEELVKLLNYDIYEHIKNITKNDIVKECSKLYLKYQQDKIKWPSEPSSNKLYHVWLNITMNYTKVIKPIESDLKLYYSKILECPNVEILNYELYHSFKSCLKEWYNTNSHFKNMLQ